MQKNGTAAIKILCLVLFSSAILYACSKSDGGGGTANPCVGVTISVSGTVTDADAGSSNGSIVALSAGGSGASTFSIDGGTFQSSGIFNNLSKGNHTIVAKDNKGCTGSNTFIVGEKNVCAGVNITLTAMVTSSDPCGATGTITANAAGSTGFTYSIDAGSFQASNVFNNVTTGNHTVNVKDASGCSKNIPVNVTAAAAGPFYTAVKAIVQTNCAIPSCHTGAAPTGGINFSIDCNIPLNKDRIRARAIDGNPSIMPPTGALAQGDKDKITAWLNAGGRFTD